MTQDLQTVTVEIEEGGISLIRITDNGCGIAKQDVENAFLRHSTSKIRSAEDLTHLSSLGFRGEALSSISAVARVELITKTREDVFGTKYIIEGGKGRNAGGDRSAGWDDLSCASAVFQYTCQTQIPEDADDRGKPYQ